MIRITHYIDRQFGHPIHIGTESPDYNVVKFVAPCEEGEAYSNKLRQNLCDKTIDDAKSYLKTTFKGVFMAIKPFDTPLQNKIEDYI